MVLCSPPGPSTHECELAGTSSTRTSISPRRDSYCSDVNGCVGSSGITCQSSQQVWLRDGRRHIVLSGLLGVDW